jgi:hypothetical protein
MRTGVLIRPRVFLRVRCIILILLIKTVHFSIRSLYHTPLCVCVCSCVCEYVYIYIYVSLISLYPITRPEEYYRVWCVIACEREARQCGGPGPLDLSRSEKRNEPLRVE